MTLDPGQQIVPLDETATLASIVDRHQPTQDTRGIVCRTCGTPFPCETNTTATRSLVRVVEL